MDKQLNDIILGEKLIYEALVYLDEQLTKNEVLSKTHLSARIITNFALLQDPVLENREKFKNIAKETASIYGLENNWINTDLASANIDLKSLEWNIGKLHFHFKADLKNISIETLDLSDVLKMRIISLDSLITSVNFEKSNSLAENLIKDILALCDFEGIKDVKELEKIYNEFVINKDTFNLINNNFN